MNPKSNLIFGSNDFEQSYSVDKSKFILTEKPKKFD